MFGVKTALALDAWLQRRSDHRHPADAPSRDRRLHGKARIRARRA